MTQNTPRRTRSPWSRPPGGDRGSVSAELAIATPLLLGLLLSIVQFALWMHAAHIAEATAAQALDAVRVEGGTAATGHAQAATVLNQIGRGVLRDPHVTVTRTAEEARVEITGTAQAVLPWLRLPVRATAHGPTERFRPPGG